MRDPLKSIRPALHTTQEAAAYLDIKPHTLAVWRWKGTGPAFIRVGRRIRYRQADLDAWLAQHTVLSGGAAA